MRQMTHILNCNIGQLAHSNPRVILQNQGKPWNDAKQKQKTLYTVLYFRMFHEYFMIFHVVSFCVFFFLNYDAVPCERTIAQLILPSRGWRAVQLHLVSGPRKSNHTLGSFWYAIMDNYGRFMLCGNVWHETTLHLLNFLFLASFFHRTIRNTLLHVGYPSMGIFLLHPCN